MNRKILSIALFVLAGMLFSSCSGVKQVINCSGTTCVNQNGTVSFVLTATPPDPNSQLSIQAFTATITGITLTPSSGSDVSLPLNATTYIAEFNRVTSDSTILTAGASVPAATYTQVKISFSAPTVTFCTQPNAGVPGCAAGTLTSVSGAAGSASTSINLSLGVNQRTGIAINVNLGSTLTLSTQTVTAVNLGANNVFSAALLPPASTATDLASGQLSHIDDVLGVVTSASGSTLTVHTITRGDITATANTSTQYNCVANTFNGCVQLNGVAIVDTILNTDGTFTLTFYEPVDTAATDIIEGVVTGVPNSVTNQVPIVVTDTVFASSNSILSGQVHLGDKVVVTYTSTAGNTFTIISKGLGLPIQNFTSSNNVSAILPGQTIAFPAITFIAQSGVTTGSAGTQNIALRYTRISGTVTSVALPFFSGNNLSPFFGLTLIQEFGTTNGRLSLDGVSTLTGIANGSAYSTSALYLGTPSSPQFVAQTVRAH
jgi:hypothetical protein